MWAEMRQMERRKAKAHEDSRAESRGEAEGNTML